jgi:hypothetical protein
MEDQPSKEIVMKSLGRASEATKAATLDGTMLDNFIAVPSEQPLFVDGVEQYVGEKRPA